MSDPHTHRYGDDENTTASQPQGPPPHPPTDPGTEHTTVIPPFFASATEGDQDRLRDGSLATRKRGRSRTAGLLAAALLLGGAGGVAGAYGYDSLNDDGTAPVPGTTTSDSPLSTASSSASDTPAPEGSPEAVAASVLPSVVKINVAGQSEAGSGSGIVLSADGEILTNNHVVEVAGENGTITVNFNDGTSAKATSVGTDPVTDLAVIKAEGVSGLTPAKLGNSDTLDVGESVVAIGSPFGLAATVTSGIVSSLNRPVSITTSSQPGNPLQPPGTDSTTYPAIQTDAAINPGNSGGPLVNLKGEVVGINSSIRSSSSSPTEQGGSIGLGFAIPISKVLPVVEQLRNGQTATHARLGVTVSNKSANDGLVLGAGIESVTAGSSGADAGLKSGDIVTKVDDEPISSVPSLIATIRGYRPGDQVTLTILRNGKTQTLQATLDSDASTSAS